MSPGTPLLQVQELRKTFGGLVAVRDVDFAVAAGRITALIGPNGAGKTTIFNLISGALVPTRGRILFDGAALPVGRPHAVAARGIARTFQLTRLFGEMTVLEHVLVGCHRRGRAGWGACAFRTRAARQEEERLREEALEVLRLLHLEPRRDVVAAVLTYGEQRLVELGRALGLRPRLLLLDEPGAGLGREEQAGLGAAIQAIRDRGTTVLLVDHHMDFVMDLSDHVLVLSYGEKLAEGPPEAVRRHPAVIAAYLGEEDEAC
jgi:ABC-type branched-subunit amino acid transport system ATPase component